MTHEYQEEMSKKSDIVSPYYPKINYKVMLL